GTPYLGFLAVSMPFVVVGFGALLFFAQRAGGEVETDIDAPLDRGAVAVVLYPIALITAVAVVNYLLPVLSLTASIAVTIAGVVAAIATVAAVSMRGVSPFSRLASETRDSLTRSHAEFSLFASAGVLVVSLEVLGLLEPLGGLLRALPEAAVPLALAGIVTAGFLLGIHVIPMILLIDSTFPLDSGATPALWAVAIILGAQAALMATPFSNSVTMLSRLLGIHPIEIGKQNRRFALTIASAAVLYLGIMTWLLL
ncbi:MAG: hypothetical protein ACRDSJ_00780, partial [Rubrobacteraceae bacterium]